QPPSPTSFNPASFVTSSVACNCWLPSSLSSSCNPRFPSSMSFLPGQCQTQTLAAQLVFTTVGSPRRHPNLHRLFLATVESRLVFIASFVTDAWRSVGRHAMPPSLHVRRSLCTVLAQPFSPSGGCSWRSLSCCSVSCHLRRNP
ncbi:hypothetical protein PIB30_109352, partial [Stylosanthes scabra]|nr:hypothetical protein [Stylosanthes scabra]